MSAEKEDSEQEPKIVIDTDWKEQVAKEKEAVTEPEATTEEAAVSTNDDSVDSSSEPAEMPPLPPATFETLVSMIFTQALAALGQIPDPSTGEATVNKAFAKHHIDTLDMLSEKTKGNLSESEAKIVDEALHAMRMAFVNTP